ncbi:MULTISPECIES: SpoIID/LytB domain-containing protein [unclassified Synechococcus]|uniref:SpoIID/LytB domain-containing protein n=1 Tax=Synechococcales TaxID=1890424 RepID=UPI0021054F03|nr:MULTISPECIES: SpoIID/LytB domain-containing protein [unclassified Synechococcus]
MAVSKIGRIHCPIGLIARGPRAVRSLLLAAALLPQVLLAGPEGLAGAPAGAQNVATLDALEPLMASRATNPQLRVLLLDQPAIRVAGNSGLRLRDARGRELLQMPAWATLTLRQVGGRIEARPSAVAKGRSGRLTLSELWLEPLPGSGGSASLQIEKRRYRGRLQVRANASKLRAINVIPLETYLPSVVGSEMPASWPLEALRAQAVAARTYALRHRKPSAPFDLHATVTSQAYKGLEAETTSTREAVRSTQGLVLMHGNSLINAVFHSSSGGSTENSGDLWSRQLPYLVSVPDYDDSSPVARWEKTLSPQQLARAFAEIGGARRIDVLSTTGSGRVRQARVIGPSGALVLSGAQLRKRLGLRSTLVRFKAAPFTFSGPSLAGRSQPRPIALTTQVNPGLGSLPASPPPRPLAPPSPVIIAVGRGFGHGVGMSQWGAFALAQQGKRFEQILQHYYRGVEVQPLRAGSGPLASGTAAGRGS